MKKRVIALLPAAALLLSGCSAMLERSYVSAEAHVDYAVMDDDSVLRAETYQGLVSSFLYFINEHSEGGSIRLYNYTGDVEADLASARDEVLERDPIGAFAVSALDYDSTRILTYYEVEVRVSYAHTAQEVEDIQPLSSVSGLRQEFSRMVDERQEQAVFLVSYFSGDANLADTLFELAVYNAPDRYCYPDGLSHNLRYDISIYPETGTRRVVEVRVDWPGSSEEADQEARKLEEAAANLLGSSPLAEDGYTPAALAELVRTASGPYDDHGSDLPLNALTGEPVHYLGQLLAVEYLCQQRGIEATMVIGEPSFWLIVSTPEGFRHLLPGPFFTLNEDGTEPPFRLYTDQELIDMGYAWSAALYPACVGEPSPVPSDEPVEEPVPES